MTEEFMNEEQVKLPNDTLTLVFGILAIVFAFCCQPIGLVFGLLAFIWGNKGKALFYENPDKWLDASFSNIKLGRLLGLIGLILSLLFLIYTIYQYSVMGPEIMEQYREILEEMGQ